LELEFFMKRRGATALSFETIAASGKRSAMPHGAASDKVIEKGDFLTLDFGCVFEGYCSDMTRTVAVGSVNDTQREIYDVVLKAQLAAIEAVRPGVKCCDVDAVARKIITDAGYGENFGHGLGHSVGIEIHEMPSFSSKCEEHTKVGHVITVEPGIYIEDFGGVRIEDLIVVTEDGSRNLTTSPKELIIV
jgi:Xaa-Pro aminopeptidase